MTILESGRFTTILELRWFTTILEPGHYTTILEPGRVTTILASLPWGVNKSCLRNGQCTKINRGSNAMGSHKYQSRGLNNQMITVQMDFKCGKCHGAIVEIRVKLCDCTHSLARYSLRQNDGHYRCCSSDRGLSMWSPVSLNNSMSVHWVPSILT